MALDAAPITNEHFRRLHPIVIDDPERIRSLLEGLRHDRRVLRRAINRHMDAETAFLERLNDETIVLRTEHFEPDDRAYVFLNFEIDRVQYFFSARRITDMQPPYLHTRIPSAVYRTERRDRTRRRAASVSGEPRQLLVVSETVGTLQARVEDSSPAGLAITLTEAFARQLGDEVDLRFGDPLGSGSEARGRIRYRVPVKEQPGWTRIGIDLSPAPSRRPVEIEHRTTISGTGSWRRARLQWQVLAQGARLATARATRDLVRRPGQPPQIEVVRYQNREGEHITAIIDSCGTTQGAPAVVIPPAWGRTKETLLPLARTIVAAFAASGQAVTVIRFDGIRKRGESYNDPDCRSPGTENRRFTCSQGVRDIRATLDFLNSSPRFQPRKTVLVSFSASALEARKAVALEGGQRIHGWISVVGSPDLQSMMRVISGGVDYVAGVERGVSFGIQEVLGVFVDIDRTGADAIANGLAFLDDARRDLLATNVPITWFCGEYDAWMDRARTLDILSHGNTQNRKLIVIPTGHQLRTSRQAFEVFQAIASEVGQMTLGAEVPAVLPNLVDMDDRRRAERNRRAVPSPDLRQFWHDYLVGRDGSVGIELQVNTSYYRRFMEGQIQALALRPGDRVADLGSGTGAFVLQLSDQPDRPQPLYVHHVDFVRQALTRARDRFEGLACNSGLRVGYAEASLDSAQGPTSIPARSEAFDAVLASLLIGYVSDPAWLLREIRRILRPHGRLVLSNMRRDGDISKIFLEGLAELRQGIWRERLGDEGSELLDAAARNLLNEGARLLELEEAGSFRFWDSEELTHLVRAAGFRSVTTTLAYGEPPQVVVLTAERP